MSTPVAEWPGLAPTKSTTAAESLCTAKGKDSLCIRIYRLVKPNKVHETHRVRLAAFQIYNTRCNLGPPLFAGGDTWTTGWLLSSWNSLCLLFLFLFLLLFLLLDSFHHATQPGGYGIGKLCHQPFPGRSIILFQSPRNSLCL